MDYLVSFFASLVFAILDPVTAITASKTKPITAAGIASATSAVHRYFFHYFASKQRLHSIG
jgi:alcohol dehydrogenase YqhD (iron-dependent ADH family)